MQLNPNLALFKKQIIVTLATLGSVIAKAAPANSEKHVTFFKLCRIIANYCGPLTPEEEVSQLYHPNFIENVGLARLARLRVVTGVDLDVDENLPWFIDENFPAVDVSKMPVGVVRGESSVKNTIFGRRKTAFIAIRYISNKPLTDQKVEFIFQAEGGSGWGQNLFGFGTRVTFDDYARLRDFLDGNPIKGAPECSRTHNVPDERFTIA